MACFFCVWLQTIFFLAHTLVCVDLRGPISFFFNAHTHPGRSEIEWLGAVKLFAHQETEETKENSEMSHATIFRMWEKKV